MFESQNPEKINIKDLSLEESEKEGKTPEELREEFRDFLVETFSKWYLDDAARARIPEAANHLPEITTLHDQNWQKKKGDVVPSKFGEYTLNLETIDIDWGAIPSENIRIEKLPDNWNNKPLADVAEYITKTYGADYYIPGLEYWKYILENPGKTPDQLKDGNWHYFFGSVLRNAHGHWDVSRVGWNGAVWCWGMDWLENSWYTHYRVALLEKVAAVRKQKKDFLKPTPPMPEVRKF